MPRYEWQEEKITAFIQKRQRQVTAMNLVVVDDTHLDGVQRIPTGLAYALSYPPMYYFFSDPVMGYYGSYHPLHRASCEQLVSACWSNERTIRTFLQMLVEASPSPDFWCTKDRVACIEQFGFPTIKNLEDQSIQIEGQRKSMQVVQLICKLMFGEGYMNPIPPKQSQLEPEALALIHEAGAEEGTHQSPHFFRSYYWYVVGEMLYCEVERRPGEYLDLFRKVQGIRREC